MKAMLNKNNPILNRIVGTSLETNANITLDEDSYIPTIGNEIFLYEFLEFIEGIIDYDDIFDQLNLTYVEAHNIFNFLIKFFQINKENKNLDDLIEHPTIEELREALKDIEVSRTLYRDITEQDVIKGFPSEKVSEEYWETVKDIMSNAKMTIISDKPENKDNYILNKNYINLLLDILTDKTNNKELHWQNLSNYDYETKECLYITTQLGLKPETIKVEKYSNSINIEVGKLKVKDINTSMLHKGNYNKIELFIESIKKSISEDKEKESKENAKIICSLLNDLGINFK